MIGLSINVPRYTRARSRAREQHGVRNDLERDWKPWARAMGYEIEAARTSFEDTADRTHGASAWEANVKFQRVGAR